MLDEGSPATAELVQQVVLLNGQVVLLNGQALIDAVHDPTVSPDTHAGLDICVLCAAQLTCRLYVCVEIQKRFVSGSCSHSRWHCSILMKGLLSMQQRRQQSASVIRLKHICDLQEQR